MGRRNESCPPVCCSARFGAIAPPIGPPLPPPPRHRPHHPGPPQPPPPRAPDHPPPPHPPRHPPPRPAHPPPPPRRAPSPRSRGHPPPVDGRGEAEAVPHRAVPEHHPDENHKNRELCRIHRRSPLPPNDQAQWTRTAEIAMIPWKSPRR